MLVRPMLLHRMALVSVRLFCKNLGNLQEFFGQMVYRPPPLAKNSPYAYAHPHPEIPKVPPPGVNLYMERKLFIIFITSTQQHTLVLDIDYEFVSQE